MPHATGKSNMIIKDYIHKKLHYMQCQALCFVEGPIQVSLCEGLYRCHCFRSPCKRRQWHPQELWWCFLRRISQAINKSHSSIQCLSRREAFINLQCMILQFDALWLSTSFCALKTLKYVSFDEPISWHLTSPGCMISTGVPSFQLPVCPASTWSMESNIISSITCYLRWFFSLRTVSKA